MMCSVPLLLVFNALLVLSRPLGKWALIALSMTAAASFSPARLTRASPHRKTRAVSTHTAVRRITHLFGLVTQWTHGATCRVSVHSITARAGQCEHPGT